MYFIDKWKRKKKERKNWFKLLSKNLKANILVNGFTTESINIEQSVKQGDALSCSLFILFMDPQIRKVNGDIKIEGLDIGINSEYIDKVFQFSPTIPLQGGGMPPMILAMINNSKI